MKKLCEREKLISVWSIHDKSYKLKVGKMLLISFKGKKLEDSNYFCPDSSSISFPGKFLRGPASKKESYSVAKQLL